MRKKENKHNKKTIDSNSISIFFYQLYFSNYICMLTRKLIDQAMFCACGRTRGGQRGGGENATIALRKTREKNKKRRKRKTDYTRYWMKTGKNWDENSDEARVALRDDHDKSCR